MTRAVVFRVYGIRRVAREDYLGRLVGYCVVPAVQEIVYGIPCLGVEYPTRGESGDRGVT